MKPQEIENGSLGVVYNISLPIERLLGMGDTSPSKNYILSNDTLSISLGVIVKGILGSIDRSLSNKIIMKKNIKAIIPMIDDQLSSLVSMANNLDNKELKIQVHISKSKEIYAGNTIASMTNLLIEDIEKYYSNEFPTYKHSTLLMTNNPFDLMKLPSSSYVVNTHTGDLLGKYELSSKLRRGGSYDTSTFPICEVTFKIFGDSYHYFKGLGITKKRLAASLLASMKVTPKTSESRIKNILKREKGLIDDI